MNNTVPSVSAFTPPNAENPKVFFINDCTDDNAQAIQAGEFARYHDSTPTFVGITSEIQAAFNLVDCLNTLRHGKRGGIAVNAAPRSGTVQNGIDFGHFAFGHAFVVTTIGEDTLSLAGCLGVTETVRVLNTEKTVDFLIECGFVSPDDRNNIIENQFRSSVFSPAVLAYLLRHGDDGLPSTAMPTPKESAIIGKICWKDNFRNLKIAKAADTLGDIPNGTLVDTALPAPNNRLPFYSHLSKVPDGQTAIIRGSSGVGTRRLLELVIKGGHAGDVLGLDVGDRAL